MNRILKFLLPVGLFAVLVGFFVIGLQKDPSRIPSPLINKPAPAFSLESLGDPDWRVSTADLAGRPYLLNVWATWCGGCREEHDVLLAIARENQLPMIGLNWKDDRALALSWLAQLGNPYAAVAFDPEGKTAIDWGVYGAPETFLVSAEGRVLRKQIGPLTMAIWNRDFRPLLAQAGVQP